MSMLWYCFLSLQARAKPHVQSQSYVVASIWTLLSRVTNGEYHFQSRQLPYQKAGLRRYLGFLSGTGFSWEESLTSTRRSLRPRGFPTIATRSTDLFEPASVRSRILIIRSTQLYPSMSPNHCYPTGRGPEFHIAFPRRKTVHETAVDSEAHGPKNKLSGLSDGSIRYRMKCSFSTKKVLIPSILPSSGATENRSISRAVNSLSGSATLIVI